MIKASVKVEIKLGLHARPILYLVTSLKDLDAKIIGNYKERTANLNSVMEGLLLGVPQGEDVEVEAERPMLKRQ